jgi:hypothetical protein
MEARAEAESATYQAGVANLVTPRIFFEVMVAKSFAGLTDEDSEVSLDQGLAAARELGKLASQDDDEAKWAKVHSRQALILAAFRALPPQFRQQVLETVENRTPPPPGGARLAVIEATPATDDDFDSGEDDDED